MELDPIGSKLGAYVIDAQLGEGSMGLVYLAHHEHLGRQVALKVLRDELLPVRRLVQRFLQEGRIVNQVAHEHLVEIYDFVHEQDPERVYCVMELLRGETLAQRLATRGVSLESLHRIAREVASALGAAHAVGVVHRDLKPENIFLISRDGRDDWVKVLDFGVARSEPWAGEVNLVESQVGGLLGTPRYMAPEQVAGLAVDARADVYALGTVLYESLAGRPPFEAESFGQLSADIISQPPPPLPARTTAGEAVPAELAALIMTCLSKHAEERPGMQQFLAWDEAVPTPRHHRAPRRLSLAAASVLVVSAFTVTAPTASTPRAAALPVAALPVAAPEPTTVTLTVSTHPAGALVSRLDTGQPLGLTPFEVPLARSTDGLSLTVELTGFVPQEHRVFTTRPVTLDATLVATPKAPPRRRQVSHRLAGNLDKAIFYCGRFLDTKPPQPQVDMTEGLLRHLELEQLRVVNSLRLELEKTRLEVAKHEALTVSRRLELERALMADWEAHPVTTRWWFWTGLAALTAGTVVALVALGLAPSSR